MHYVYTTNDATTNMTTSITLAEGFEVKSSGNVLGDGELNINILFACRLS